MVALDRQNNPSARSPAIEISPSQEKLARPRTSGKGTGGLNFADGHTRMRRNIGLGTSSRPCAESCTSDVAFDVERR